MKFILTSDLHLGRCSSLPETGENIHEISAGDIWLKIADMALDPQEPADAILIAGDVFDGSSTPFTSKKLLNEGLKKLEGKNIKVIMVPGNHDAKRIKKTAESLNFDFVSIIGCGSKWEEYKFSDSLNIYGFGLGEKYLKSSPFSKKLKRDPDRKYILMLHGDYTASQGNYGPFSGDLSCDSIKNSLITLSGHIHKPFRKENFVNAGSPLAFDFGEKGHHGVFVLKLDDNDMSAVSLDFVPISPIYYGEKEIDLKEFDPDKKSLENILSENLPKEAEISYYRITLSGRVSKENQQVIENELEDLKNAGNEIYDGVYADTENIVNGTLRDYDLPALAAQKNAVGVAAGMLYAIEQNRFFDNEEYRNIFEEAKNDINDYVKDINPSYKYLPSLSDEEILVYIRKSLINILDRKEEN